MDDRALAEGCRRGDRAAWDEFVTRYTRFIAYAVRRQLRASSEEAISDVVQNVFLELLRENRKAWARYDPRFRLTTWLGLVVLTQVDRSRRAAKPPPDKTPELAREVDCESIERVRAALPALSERERLIVSLYYFDGLSTREIATITGVPPNTVASHLMRAREKLKEKLQ